MYKPWNKKIWIAKKIGVEDDDYGNEVAIYSKPELYEMNVQPASSKADIALFGEHAQEMQKTVIEQKKYLYSFKDFDVAYLDGATPEDEDEFKDDSIEVYHCINANYRLFPPRNQNKCITIYFEKITGK